LFPLRLGGRGAEQAIHSLLMWGEEDSFGILVTQFQPGSEAELSEHTSPTNLTGDSE
jgi:hypothetical protein